MNKLVTKFIKDESGATAIEYGLIVALIGVALIGAATTLGQDLQGLFTNLGETITGVADSDAAAGNQP